MDNRDEMKICDGVFLSLYMLLVIEIGYLNGNTRYPQAVSFRSSLTAWE